MNNLKQVSVSGCGHLNATLRQMMHMKRKWSPHTTPQPSTSRASSTSRLLVLDESGLLQAAMASSSPLICIFPHNMNSKVNYGSKTKLCPQPETLVLITHKKWQQNVLLVPGLCWRCALSNHLFRTMGFTRIGRKILSGVLVVEFWHPSIKHHLYAVFFVDILDNFQLSFYTKMRLRAIVHNDVTLPYHRKHSTASGTFSVNLKFILFLRS